MVFHSAIVEYIRADLASPFDFFLPCFYFGGCLTAFFQFQFVELTPQVAQSVLSILRLVARLGIFDNYLVGLVGERVDKFVVQTHSGFHFVDILTTCTRGTECIPRDTGRIHINLYAVINQRNYKNGSKRGHAFTLGVVRADTHQTMYSVFAFQIPVSHIAFYIEGYCFDASLVAFL